MEPATYGDGKTGVEVSQPIGLHQCRRLIGCTCGDGVRNSLAHVVVLAQPVGRTLMKLGYAVGLVGLESTSCDGPEQVMEPKPALLLVKGNQEEIAVFKLPKKMCGAATSGHVVGERRRKPVEHGHAKDEVPHFVGLSAEHFLREVLTDEAIVPAEMVHELRRIASTGQRQRRQVESCRPTFSSTH